VDLAGEAIRLARQLTLATEEPEARGLQPQILAWYDDLVALTDDPVRQDPAAVLGRAVAVGHVLGAPAGLRETDNPAMLSRFPMAGSWWLAMTASDWWAMTARMRLRLSAK
jgi:predicted RNA polymerase sigma factor